MCPLTEGSCYHCFSGNSPANVCTYTADEAVTPVVKETVWLESGKHKGLFAIDFRVFGSCSAFLQRKNSL